MQTTVNNGKAAKLLILGFPERTKVLQVFSSSSSYSSSVFHLVEINMSYESFGLI